MTGARFELETKEGRLKNTQRIRVKCEALLAWIIPVTEEYRTLLYANTRLLSEEGNIEVKIEAGEVSEKRRPRIQNGDDTVMWGRDKDHIRRDFNMSQ